MNNSQPGQHLSKSRWENCTHASDCWFSSFIFNKGLERWEAPFFSRDLIGRWWHPSHGCHDHDLSFGAIHNKRVMSRFLVFLATHPSVCVIDAAAFVNLILQGLVKASVRDPTGIYCVLSVWLKEYLKKDDLTWMDAVTTVHLSWKRGALTQVSTACGMFEKRTHRIFFKSRFKRAKNATRGERALGKLRWTERGGLTSKWKSNALKSLSLHLWAV